MNKYCKGSYLLGTACGKCEKCHKEKEHLISSGRWPIEHKKRDHKENKLYPCPCDYRVRCIMDEPCLGCETYDEWLKLL